MGGLRALCCSSGDVHDDDGLDTAARPSQQRPEKEKQSAPPNVKKEPSLGKSTPRDLWKEAYDGLHESRKKYVPANGIPATDAIQGVIDSTTAKYEEWQKGGLKIHRKSGKDINLRDTAEKILGAAMKAQDVISTAVSFDPTGHASSAWTVISFGMSIVQNRLDRRDAIFESSEYIAENLAYFALVDVEYRNQGVGSDKNIDQALLRVYSAILDFAAEVKKGQDENEASRTWHSIFALTDQPLSQLKTTIEAQSKIARQWIGISSNIGDRKRAEEHLARTDKNIEISRNIESKVKTAEEENQLVWMSKADFSARQGELQKRRTGDTGIWLLDSQEYNDWKYTPGDILWLPGISGCGKSVLCSTVIQDLEEICRLDPSKFLAYWYFQFDKGDTRSVDALTRSLIRQLSRSPLIPSVTGLWSEHHLRGSQPDSKTILAVLDDVISRISGQVYLVFDALDECPQNPDWRERESLLSLLIGLLERHKDKVHILATSRSEHDIAKELEKFSMLDLESRLAEDVKEFVTAAISRHPLERYSEEAKNLIFVTLLSSRERRFRWAELQIKVLEKKRDEEDVKEALKKLPQSLEGTYRKILDDIAPDDVSRAREILMIICLSPVTLDVNTVAKMARVYAADIIPICTTSLVNVFDDKIQVAHFSVQEFLIVSENGSEQHECQFTVTDGHKCLAEKTLDCLLAQTEPLTEADAMKLPSFLYATKHWNTHLAAAGDTDQSCPGLQAKVYCLFTESNVYFNWVRGSDSDDRPHDNQWSKVLMECEPPIQRASGLGLIHTVNTLVTQGADPLQSWEEMNSLSMAAQQGHLDVVQALLKHNLPLDQHIARSILKSIDHRKAGRAKLLMVLETLREQGLLHEQSTDASDTLSEDAVIGTMQSQWSGVEILSIFLDWRPKITVPMTDNVLVHAICWARSPKATLKLLFERCDFRVPRAALERVLEKTMTYSIEGLALLAVERPNELPIIDRLVRLFALKDSSETMKSLLRTRREDVRVTQGVLEDAAENPDDAGMVPLLWAYREPGTKVTQQMLVNASSKRSHAHETVEFLLEQLGPSSTLNEEVILGIIRLSQDGVATLKMLLGVPTLDLSVSEELVKAICGHRDALEMLKLLAKDGGLDFPITEPVVSSAASNRSDAPSVLGYLAQLSQGHLPVTEEALVQAVTNLERVDGFLKILEKGDGVLKLLMPDAPDTIFTDKVFKSACSNKDAMVVLLDQKRREPPLEEMLSRIVELEGFSTDVLQILLERHLLNVDEHLVEKLAVSFHALNVLLSWKPDAPITENALLLAARDPRSMRLMMAHQGNSLTITEDILIAAADAPLGVEVMEAILNRQGSIPITEKVIRAACINRDMNELQWFLDRQPESFVREVWHDIWTDADFDINVRYTALLVFLKKTDSKITDTMLQDFPYDPNSPNNYCFGDFVKALCGLDDDSDDSDDEDDDGLPDLPATERAAEIIVERCGKEAIEAFLKCKEIAVTDSLIQAAEKNRIADKEELMAFLEQKRG